MAIEDVNLMFRKDRRMEPREIALTAKRIVDKYWYFKPEDIKKCFEGRRPKQFVLEGDSFLSWVAEYDLQRDNACEDEAQNGKENDVVPNAISHEVYLGMLKSKANSGDKDALKILEQYQKRSKILSQEELRRKEADFKLYRHKYLKSKGLIKTT